MTGRDPNRTRDLDLAVGDGAPAGATLPSLLETLDQIDREADAATELEGGLVELDEAPAVLRGRRHIAFSLGESNYAVEVGSVVEVADASEPTIVPHVPDWIRGVINLRGEILALVDVRLLLGLEPSAVRQADRMLVVRTRNEEVSAALLVDSINGLTTAAGDELAAPAAPISDQLAPFLLGVMEREGGLLAVLDLDKLLLSPQVRQFEAN